MGDATIRQQVTAALQALGRQVPADDHAPLDLDSLTIVTLHERLELMFGIRVRAREVTPDVFGSVQGLVRLVRSKIGGAR